jgi:hypothetical protein
LHTKPVEFEDEPVEVQDFGKNTDCFKGISRVNLKFHEEKTERCEECNVKNLPGHWIEYSGLLLQ